MTNWQIFWSNLDDPKHRSNSSEWLQLAAEELLLYFPKNLDCTLELGCGNGDFYDYFADRFPKYIGIDYSYAMLAKFQKRYPKLTLLQADASNLPLEIISNNTYNLVFSNGVCQYLDEVKLSQNLIQVHHLLSDKGVYFVANIPDAELRFHYYAGGLRADGTQQFWSKFLWQIIIRLVKQRDDGMGHWYSRRWIHVLAEKHGFVCETFSSALYEYRFHARLTKANGKQSHL